MAARETNLNGIGRIALGIVAMAVIGFPNTHAYSQGHDPKSPHDVQRTAARRIIDMAGWSDSNYAWLSNNSVLLFRQVWDSVKGSVDAAYELDTRTLDQKPLEGFNRRLHEGDVPSGRVVRSTLSPDRQWLCWFDGPNTMTTPADTWRAIRLDGTKSIAAPVGFGATAFGVWSRRSDEWITWGATGLGEAREYVPFVGTVPRTDFSDHRAENVAVHYSLASPRPRIVPVTDLRSADTVHKPNQVGPFLLGITPQERGVAADPVYERVGSMNFFDIDVEAGSRTSRKWVVRFPAGAQAWDVAISPQADQLAWAFSFEHPYHDRQVTKERNATVEIWISRLNRSEMRMVYYQNTTVFNSELGILFSHLHWSPDGRQLGFIRSGESDEAAGGGDNALYSIPAY